MNKQIIKIVGAIGTTFLLAGIGYKQIFHKSNNIVVTESKIFSYQPERDKQEILDIFKKNWYWLIASRENYDPDFIEFLLDNRTPSKEEQRYYGKLVLKVLRENNEFIGFTAYYMKNFFIGQILFVAVRSEFRGKGYAQKLMQHAINDLKQQGATSINLLTRTTNETAQKLYKRLGFQVMQEDNGFVYFELKNIVP